MVSAPGWAHVMPFIFPLLVRMCCFCRWHSPQGPIWRHWWCCSPERASHWYPQSSGVPCQQEDATPISQLRQLQFEAFIMLGTQGWGVGTEPCHSYLNRARKKSVKSEEFRNKMLATSVQLEWWICVNSFACPGLQLWKVESNDQGKFYISVWGFTNMAHKKKGAE
jgi:hypothetical protein